MKHAKHLLLLVFVVVVAASATAQIVTDGLVGYWNMDPADPGFGAVPPLRLVSTTGLIYGAPVYAYDAAVGPVLRFDGNWGFFMTAADELLGPRTGTLEVWVNPDAMQEADLVMKGDEGRLTYGLALLRNGAVQGSIAEATVERTREFRFMQFRTSGGRVRANEWQQVVLRWDEEMVAILVNGELASQHRYGTGGEGLVYGSAHGGILIGYQTVWNGRVTPAFHGMIGPVRLYERALGEDEILANHRFHAKTLR